MATVPENLEKIRQARYGEEVRGAIHDSIQDIYEYANGDEIDSMKLNETYRIGDALFSLSQKVSYSDFTDTYFINGNGNLEPHTDQQGQSVHQLSASPFIEIPFNVPRINSVFFPVGLKNRDLRKVAFYDASKTFLAAYDYTLGTQDPILINNYQLISDFPEDAKYFRFTYQYKSAHSKEKISVPDELIIYYSPINFVDEMYFKVNGYEMKSIPYSQFTQKKYIDKNGNTHNHKYFSYSPLVEIPDNVVSILVDSGYSAADLRGFLFYDADKNLTHSCDSRRQGAKVCGENNSHSFYEIDDVHYNDKYIQWNYSFGAYPDGSKEIYPTCQVRYGFKFGYNNKAYENRFGNKFDDTNYMTLFPRIAVCGDSLSAGHLNKKDTGDPDGGVIVVRKKFSWIANLARKNGLEYDVYATSGYNAPQWIKNWLPKLKSSTKADAYFIALCTNDELQNRNLGSIDDPNTSDSFTGQYKRIIDEIHSYSEHSVIFAVPRYLRKETDFSKRIKEIADLYDFVFYLDIPNRGEFTLDLDSFWQHFWTTGYCRVANMINKLVNDVVKENMDYFRRFGFYAPSNNIY